MESIQKNFVQFVEEKDGIPEKEFKERVCSFLKQSGQMVRAYLALIQYGNENTCNVALCLRMREQSEKNFISQLADIFESMFVTDEHLDIIILDEEKEMRLRQVCFPFFISHKYEPSTPDFYLSSSEGYEGYGLNYPHACIKIKKLTNDHPDGYLLCNVSPPLINKENGKDITQVILAHRHQGFSLFARIEWPAYVHVMLPVVDGLEKKEHIKKEDVALIAWGELYPIEEIPKHVRAK